MTQKLIAIENYTGTLPLDWGNILCWTTDDVAVARLSGDVARWEAAAQLSREEPDVIVVWRCESARPQSVAFWAGRILIDE